MSAAGQLLAELNLNVTERSLISHRYNSDLGMIQIFIKSLLAEEEQIGWLPN